MDRSAIRDYIRSTCYSLKEGQEHRIERRYFDDAFGSMCGFPGIYETPEQAFLSGMIGSGWGAFRVRRDAETGDVVVSRHQESDRRYYADPDRMYLYKKMPDGTLELRDDISARPTPPAMR